MRKRVLFFTGILPFVFLSAKAQGPELDPVTITSSINPIKASQTGRNLLVIKGERFAQLPVHSLDELLRYLPGIELQARGPFGSQSDITLRGGTFQQVLVIVDGVRVNDPNTGHFTTNIPLAPGEIDRIEILKGASSALYGSDAVGGVVNIITKTFATKSTVQKLQTTAQFTGGEYGFYSVNAAVYASNGKTSFGAGILSNNTTGQLQRGTRGFVNATTVSASVGHAFNEKWNLSFRSAYDHRKFAAQNFYTSSTADTAQETLKTFWNQLQVLRQAANNTLRVQIGYKQLQDSFAFNKLTPTNQNKTELWQALLTNERKLGANTTLTPGLQFINKKITSNDRGNHNVNLAAAFLILSQRFGEHVFVSPAARLEWNERAGWEAVPQLNLSYRSSQWQLRGSAGKTIRDADFTERYNNYNKSFVSNGQRLGNPDLEAERSFSYEAGADYFLANTLKLSGTFFQRRHKNLIDYVLTPAAQIPHNSNLAANGMYAFAKNIAEVTTTGYEGDVQFSKPLTNNSNLWVTLGLVWLNDESSNNTASLYVSSHARFQTNFAVSYTQKRFALSVNGLYKKRQQQKSSSPLIVPVTSDYVLLNAKAEAFILKNKLSAFTEVDNLLDRTYTDLLGALMPRRWFMAGIKISLAGK
ncbi:TonB-dependent receptor plug domain-containing protein [Flavisolibacter ginsenosidimutans]|nr:TonB-dependent receptor [Flavisolibacter ginsenosidimutans]